MLTRSGKDFAGSAEQDRRAGWTGALTKEWVMQRLIRILRDADGATAIEYALIASLISVVALTGMSSVGTKMNIMYQNVGNKL